MVLPRRHPQLRLPWVRDRALDHAVEKEKHLLPYHSLKNHLINQSQSESPVPGLFFSSLNSIPLRFLRLFPSSFLESFPSHSPLQPHFSPSPSLLHLHSQELLLHKSSLPDAADRLLRLLMLSPSRSIPLSLVHSLRWDLALPLDFPLSLLPLYPDYFRISHHNNNNNNNNTSLLELVCYSPHLAVSRMESYAAKTGGYTKGMPLAFPLSYPRGFEMEKKVRNWVEDWQKLPYVSPYEDGSKLPRKSEVWEKWLVGVVHEFLSLCIGRKTEKANIEMVAPVLGLPAGIGKLIRNYPGIFYVSNKLRTQTVVLREAYRRDLLVEEKHPLMGMRYQYIHLMREGRKEEKTKKKKKKKKKKSRRGDDVENAAAGEYDDDDLEEEDDEDEDEEISDSENESDDDDDDDDYEDAGQKSVQQGRPQGIWFEKMEPGMNARRNEMHRSNNVGRGNFDLQRNNNNTGRKPYGRGNSEMQRDNSTGRKLYGRVHSDEGGRAPGMGYYPGRNQRVNSRNRVST